MCVWGWFSYSKSLSTGRTNYTGGLFPKKLSPVIPSYQSKQTLTFPLGSSIQQCQITVSLMPSLSTFILRPNYCSLGCQCHKLSTGKDEALREAPSVTHTPCSPARDTTEPGNTQAAPGSQTRTEIYELCPELKFPRWGSGAPKSSQLREKCLLPGTHGQPQLDQFLNGLSELQDISINYSNSELFLLHCHCLFKHNKNHRAPMPRSDILLKHSNSQKNSGQCQGKSNQLSLILFITGKWFPTELPIVIKGVTQEGCKQEAAPHSQLSKPLYLWWTEQIPTIITIATLPIASGKTGIHSSLDTEQTKQGRRSSHGRKELMPEILKTGLSCERMWKIGTDSMYRSERTGRKCRTK